MMRFLEYHPDPGRAAAALDPVDIDGGQDGPAGVEHLQEELGVVAEVVGDRKDGDGRVLERATQATRRVDQSPVGPAGAGERGAVVEEAAEDLLEVAAAGVGEPPVTVMGRSCADAAHRAMTSTAIHGPPRVSPDIQVIARRGREGTGGRDPSPKRSS
ncbi:hypothetical protein [Embleya sp. NPDC001921]